MNFRGATVIALLSVAAGVAALQFPALTGRVVDEAGLVSRQTAREIEALAAAHEKATGNQVVVVTLPDLQGTSIEDYGYQLGRYWGIGQKDKNNGVLLIVAKAERKVRIEVGYGLEGELTDAIASNIINTVVTPAFKRADFDGGLANGTRAIVAALGGEYKMRTAAQSTGVRINIGWIVLAFFLVFWLIPTIFSFFGFRRSFLLGALLSSGRSRGGGGFGGGGFSGGGGSFGGGGASGGW